MCGVVDAQSKLCVAIMQMVCPPLQMSFQVQYGSSKLPQKFYTGEVDAFWRSETSLEESRRHYLEERDKLRKAQAEKQQQDAGDKASTPAAQSPISGA